MRRALGAMMHSELDRIPSIIFESKEIVLCNALADKKDNSSLAIISQSDPKEKQNETYEQLK